jgi:hypothetical protein
MEGLTVDEFVDENCDTNLFKDKDTSQCREKPLYSLPSAIRGGQRTDFSLIRDYEKKTMISRVYGSDATTKYS